jgi:hypothetical protein
MKKLWGILVIIPIVLVSMAACESVPPGQGTDLQDWEGTWNSFSTYLDNSGLNATYTALATEGSTTEVAVKADLEASTHSDIVAVSIKGDTITFYGAPQTKEGGTGTSTAKYSYTGKVDVVGGWGTFPLDHFETTGNGAFKHLVLTPVETLADGAPMTHFHFRYGESLAALNADPDPNWLPKMVAYDTTIDQVIAELTEEEE